MSPGLEQMRAAQPRLGLVLGSGLSEVADAFGVELALPYAAVPGLSAATVPGHAGHLLLARCSGVPVLIAQGRRHLYEGVEARQVASPVRLIHDLGVRTVVLTNAAGAINARFRCGELMLIRDQLNLTGTSPLLGGPNFKDMSAIYTPSWCEALCEVARQEGVPLHEGVYAGVTGPQYETPAEIRMLRVLGADAVGMSTVLEAIQARALDMDVIGLSTLTNWAAGITKATLSHDEVVAAGKAMAGSLVRLLRALIGRLA